MHTGRRFSIVVSLVSALTVAGCADLASPAAPPARPLAGAETGLSNGATTVHVEFDHFNDYDIVLSCMNGESTHWEGWVHVTLDVTTTPSGITQERIAVAFDPGYFVERENGVRYDPVGPFPVNEHHLFGPVTVIAGTAAGSWKSADGVLLILGFHAQFVYDTNGDPVLEKFTGACP
jgi:hypothetical protein